MREKVFNQWKSRKIVFSTINSILVFYCINEFDERVAFQNNTRYFAIQMRGYQWRTRKNDERCER